MTTNVAGVENQEQDEKTYCTVHPEVETGLRCNRCGRYMCTRCAVLTPVGYRCKQCVNQQQDAFYKATQQDYVVGTLVAFALAVPLGFVGARLALILVLFLGIPAGALLGEAVFRACGRRKARYMPHIAVGAIVVGAIIGVLTMPLMGQILPLISEPGALSYLIGEALSALIFAAMAGVAAFGRLR